MAQQKKKFESGGVLGPIFENLRRPGLAVTEGTKRVVIDKGSLDDFIRGLGAGFTGKSSVSGFSDVLAGARGSTNPNRWEALGGFGLDIVADPLTYLSGGVSKGIAPDVALTQAIRESSLKKGITEAAFKPAVEAATERIMAESPAAAYVKFGGKEVYRSEELARKANRLLDTVIKNPEGQHRTLAKAFSRSAELPYGLDKIDRLSAMSSTASFEKEIDPIIGAGRNLTLDETDQVSKAISRGQIGALKGIAPSVVENPNGFRDLADYAEFYSNVFKEFGQREVALGLRDVKNLKENYVPRYLRGNQKNVVRDTKGGEKSVMIPSDLSPEPSTKLKAITQDFDVLKDRGFDPITDIRAIAGMRGAKHYSMVTRAKMIGDSLDLNATPLTKENKEYLYSKDFVKASTVNHPVAGLDKYKDHYIPREVKESLNGLQKTLDSDRTSAKMLRLFDRALDEWKYLATATPQTKLRNALSDGIMNWQDGVNHPKYYSNARKIGQWRKESNDSDLLTANLPRGVAPPKKTPAPKIQVGELKAGADEVWDLYSQLGGKAGFISSDLFRDLLPFQQGAISNALTKNETPFVAGMGEAISSAKGGYDKLKKWSGEQSGRQEDYFRMAHFTKALEDELPKGITSIRNAKGEVDPRVIKAAEKANDRVRKFNFDYGHLTQFEQKFMKRTMPFYSYMRQAIPQQVGMLFTRPGFMAAYPKFTNMASGFLAADSLEDDPLVPEWIRELSPFQAATEKQQKNDPLAKALRLIYGSKGGGPLVGTLAGTPVETLNRLQPIANTVGAIGEGRVPTLKETLGAGFKEFGGSTSPFIKSPFELATGKNIYTERDISDQGWTEYLAGLLPQTRVGYAGTQDIPFTGGQGLGGNLGRMLTGLDIRTVTEGAKKAEAFNQLDVLEDEYKDHSKIRNGRRVPKDSEGRQLKRQMAQLQKVVQKGRPVSRSASTQAARNPFA